MERTTARLLHNTQVGPSKATPIERRNMLLALICFTANLNATNSAPYVDASTVDCFFEVHSNGVELMKCMIPVVDLLVAWLASTKQVVLTAGPFG